MKALICESAGNDNTVRSATEGIAILGHGHKQLFQRLSPLKGVRDTNGDWHDISDGPAVDEILWQSRQQVLGHGPSAAANRAGSSRCLLS